MGFSRILSVGTAVPPFVLSQEEIRRFAAGLFRPEFEHIDRLLRVFDNGFIKTRYLSQPLEWYADSHSFAEANAIFQKVVLELAAEASLQAIGRAGIKPADIGMIVFATSTGIATPTLDAKLIQRIGIPGCAARLPIWGLGCAGGVAGLARTAELSVSRPGQYALLVTVELCSLTFQRNDCSKSNIVGTSIFSDGAAAVVLSTRGEGLEVNGSYSTLLPDSEDIMGWDLVDTGLKVRFSKDIPGIVRNCLPGLIMEACGKWGIKRSDIKHYIVHPGGAKVLDAYSESLELPKSSLKIACDVLANYGNMSSAAVLFVLERFLAVTPPSGDYGLMLALGPGFSAEQVLFRW